MRRDPAVPRSSRTGGLRPERAVKTFTLGVRPNVVLALALAVGLGGCAKIHARDLIREGNHAYEEGRFAEAITLYTESLEYEPDGVTVLWNRACAAEAQVLKLADPDARAERRKYADMALEDFHRWYERLPDRTAKDEKQVADHRLAILDADERCDDLLQHWLDKHRAEPREEQWYGVIARQYEKCGNTDKTHEWFVKRTTDFPDSVRAWHQLAIREFEPLWPDPNTGLQYNEALPPSERIRTANRVIELLDKANEVDRNFRDAYVWRNMAYLQRRYARIVIETPELPEERLEAILAREDSLLAWKQQKTICDLDEVPDCPSEPGPDAPAVACCPLPPITPEAQAADAEARAQIEAEIEASKRAAAEPERRRKRGR